MIPIIEIHLSELIKIEIPTYALFASIGFLFMVLYLYHVFRIENDKEFFKLILLVFFMSVGVVLGSKVLFIIVELPTIFSNFSFGKLVSSIITAGFVFYGGLVGAYIGLFVFSRTIKWFAYDRLLYEVIPAFPLFHSWGRIGCLFAGCCYGKQTNHGWYHLASEEEITRIPIQLYESILLLCIFIIILILKNKIQSGELISALYLLSYACVRIFLECFRGDSIRGIWLGFSTSQYISLIIIVYCVYVFIKSGMRHYHNKDMITLETERI